jgi:hypothetical protein
MLRSDLWRASRWGESWPQPLLGVGFRRRFHHLGPTAETRSDEDYMIRGNCWYAAAWSKELSDQPLAKTFFNEKVVLFRTVSDQSAALNDKCCTGPPR